MCGDLKTKFNADECLGQLALPFVANGVAKRAINITKEAMSKTYKAGCLSGHSPASHLANNIKLRIDQAKFKAEKKRLTLIVHGLATRESTRNIPLSKKFI
jgi:hypothetical protein